MVVQVHTAIIWLQVMDTEQLLWLLDCQVTTYEDSIIRTNLILEAIMDVLAKAAGRADALALQSRLPTLLRVPPAINGWERVVALALDGYLPAFYDGSSFQATSHSTLADLVSESMSWWRSIALEKYPVNVLIFLGQPQWTDLTTSVVVRLTYSQSSQRSTIRDWFRTGAWAARAVSHVVQILKALLDTCLPLSPFEDQDENMLVTLCRRIAESMLDSHETELLLQCKFCVESIAALYPTVGRETASALQGKVEAIAKRLSPTVFALALHLDASGSLGASALESGLKWAVDALSLEISIFAETNKYLAELSRGMTISEPKAHHAEAVVTVAIQNHLGNAQVLEFTRTVMEHTQFKACQVCLIYASTDSHFPSSP